MSRTEHQDLNETLRDEERAALDRFQFLDPMERRTLIRGFTTSWFVHVALVGAVAVYGWHLRDQEELTASKVAVERPVLASFSFEKPEPKVTPPPTPTVEATTTQAPEPERTAEVVEAPKVVEKPKTAKRKKRRKAKRTAQRTKAPKVTPTPTAPKVAAIAPPVADAASSTVAQVPAAAPKVASGPTTKGDTPKVAAAKQGEVDRAGLQKRYVKQLSSVIRKRHAYPRAARLAGLEGRAVVRIVLNESGQIVDIKLASSSGHAILDRAALEAARSVGKLPAAPSALQWGTRAIKVPFRFKATT